MKKAAKVFGVKNLELIPVADLLPVTGYIRGGCSPIGMKKDFPLCVDSSAEGLDFILVSGGRIGTQIKIEPHQLMTMRHAFSADLLKA